LGGAAFTFAKPSWIAGFLQNCDDVQFLSWHNYGTGDLYQSNEKLFAGVDSNVGSLAKGALEAVQKFGKGRNIETFLTETNVKYTWDPYERRHQNQVGSLFHALVVKKWPSLASPAFTSGSSAAMLTARSLTTKMRPFRRSIFTAGARNT
jgi:hypothetical protein